MMHELFWKLSILDLDVFFFLFLFSFYIDSIVGCGSQPKGSTHMLSFFFFSEKKDLSFNGFQYKEPPK